MSLFAKLSDFMGSARRPAPPPEATRSETTLAEIARLQRKLGLANRSGDKALAARLGEQLERLL